MAFTLESGRSIMSSEKASEDVNKPKSVSPAPQVINGLENVIGLLGVDSWSFPEKTAMKRKLEEFVEVIQQNFKSDLSNGSNVITESQSVLPTKKKFSSVAVQTYESMFSMQINDMPNECLTLILKFIPLQELLLLRIVCSSWKNVIEAYCGTRKTLKIFNNRSSSSFRDYSREIYCNKLDYLALNSNDDLAFNEHYLKTELLNFLIDTFSKTKHLTLSGFGNGYELYHSILLEHWPDLKSLSLHCLSNYDFDIIKSSISALNSLQRLDLLSENISVTQVPKNILAQLEQISLNVQASNDFAKVFSDLKSSCKVHLAVNGTQNITNKFMDIDVAAGKIIHLQIKEGRYMEFTPKLGNYLINLKYFELSATRKLDLVSLMKIIEHMKSLIELHVLHMDFKKTDNNSRELQKRCFKSPAKRVHFSPTRNGINCSAKILCIALSNIFPNLEMLTLQTREDYLGNRQEILDNLKMFPKLSYANIM